MGAEERDVFVSYASEDRAEVAQPLADLLSALGVNVWYDQFDLKLGDSLRGKIDAGLAGCRYGVVILSPSFFHKHYPTRELDGLAQREVDGEKVILPVWYRIDERQVRQHSPPLADRVAAQWEDGIDIVAAKVLEVVRPEILQRIRENAAHSELSRLRTGRELSAVIGQVHFSYHHHDDLESEEDADLIGGFLQEVHDWSDLWNDLEPADHVKTEFRLGQLVKELESAGWHAYGGRTSGRARFGGVTGQWTWYVLAVVRDDATQVLNRQGSVVVIRKEQEGPAT